MVNGMRQWSRPQNSAHLPPYCAELVRRDVDRVVDALDEVALLEELRHPERVVHVVGAQHEVHGAVDGDLDRRRAHLAGTFDDLALFGELESPSPLEAGDVHDDGLVGGRRLRDFSCVATLNPNKPATTTIGVTVYSTSIGTLYGFWLGTSSFLRRKRMAA